MRTLDPLDPLHPLDPSARHDDDALERMARRRAGAKMGWMIVLGTVPIVVLGVLLRGLFLVSGLCACFGHCISTSFPR